MAPQLSICTQSFLEGASAITRVLDDRAAAPIIVQSARWQLAALLSLHTALLVWCAIQTSPTFNEPARLSAGVYHWRHARFDTDIGNPPLVCLVAGLPVTLADAKIDSTGIGFAAVNGSRIFALTAMGRLVCIPFSVVGGWICWRWSTELYGSTAGFAAASLWCFCPLVLGHGALVTGDVASASFGVCAFFACRQWLHESTWTRAAITGLSLGLALLTKYVWVIMPVLWLILWSYWRWAESKGASRSLWQRDLRQIALIGVLSLYVVNVGFGFCGSFRPLEQHSLWQRALARLDASESESTTLRTLAQVPVPLPKDFAGGVNAIAQARERPTPTFLNGETRRDGSLHFYLAGLMMKIPLAGLLLFCCATVERLFSRDGDWRDDVFLAVPIVVLMVFVTWATSVQFVRYVMPVLPFLFIWTSRLFRTANLQLRPKQVWAATACLGWFVVSSVRVYPHSLSYMNELAGGPEKGHKYLVAADFDWGQDLFYLKQWVDEHPKAKPLHVSLYGSVDPRLAGIQSSPAPFVANGPSDTHGGPQPGWYAISVTELHGRNHQGYTYFMEHFEPISKAGYSIFIYRITCDDANCARQKMGLPLLDCDEQNETATALKSSPTRPIDRTGRHRVD